MSAFIAKAKYKKRSHETHTDKHVPFLKSHSPKIAFIGTSMFERFEYIPYAQEIWKTKLEKYNIGNFGVGGDKIENILYRFEQGLLKEFRKAPEKVVLLAGANDIETTKIPVMVDCMNKLVAEIRNTFPSAQIHLLGMFPRMADKKPEAEIYRRVLEFNSQIESIPGVIYHWVGDKVIDEKGFTIGKYFDDNVHFNQEGYEIFATELAKICE